MKATSVVIPSAAVPGAGMREINDPVNVEVGINTEAGNGFSVFCTILGLIAWERAGEGKPANPNRAIATSACR
jgi:hypothetical protein